MRRAPHASPPWISIACAATFSLVWTWPVMAQEPARGQGAITAPGEGRDDHVTFFIDEQGVPTLTNRVELYRDDPGYREVRIAYEPVIVPGRYTFNGGTGTYYRADIEYLVRRYARQYGLDENLVFAVIKMESDFDPYAVSRAGARGLMQLMPATASEMRVNDLYDAAQNIAGGTQYLAKLLKVFHGDLEMALAAYNAGPETVKRYGGMPPYRETRDYVRNVQRLAKRYSRDGPEVRVNATTRKPLATFFPRAKAKTPFTLHFRSGTTQPADRVFDRDPYYVIEFGGRQYTIRKDLVTEVRKNG